MDREELTLLGVEEGDESARLQVPGDLPTRNSNNAANPQGGREGRSGGVCSDPDVRLPASTTASRACIALKRSMASDISYPGKPQLAARFGCAHRHGRSRCSGRIFGERKDRRRPDDQPGLVTLSPVATA